MIIKPTTSGFTLIELIIGMTIFSIGLAGIFALLQTTMSTVRYSRDEIVVSGLLREQIDLVMNMRDTNLRNYILWDSTRVENNSQSILAPGTYTIENNFWNEFVQINNTNGSIEKSPLKLIKIDTTTSFTTDEEKWNKTRLLYDTAWRYIHSGLGITGTGTQFAAYIIISPLIVNGIEVKKPLSPDPDAKNQGWIIDVRVLVKYNGGYREYDAKSMITDWQE